MNLSDMQAESLPSEIDTSTSSTETAKTSVVPSTIPSFKRSFNRASSNQCAISQISQRAPTQSQAINSLAILSHHAAKQNQISTLFPSNKTAASPPSMFRSISSSSGIYNCAVNNSNFSQTYAPKTCISSRSAHTPTMVSNIDSSPTFSGSFSTQTRNHLATSSTPIVPAAQDWRTYLTIEERQAVRSKLRDAYTNRCTSFEDLLQVVCYNCRTVALQASNEKLCRHVQ